MSTVTGFQDAHLNAMLEQGLSSEGRLTKASWSELSAVLPHVLVQALWAAYNSSALNGPGVCNTLFANFAELLLAFPLEIIPAFVLLHVQDCAMFIAVFWLICRHTWEANACVQAWLIFVWCDLTFFPALPLKTTCYMSIGDCDSVHICPDGHYFCCIIWLLIITGKEGISNCFYVADLMIAANQTADAQEVWLLLSCACQFMLAWSVHGVIA